VRNRAKAGGRPFGRTIDRKRSGLEHLIETINSPLVASHIISCFAQGSANASEVSTTAPQFAPLPRKIRKRDVVVK